MEDDMGNSSDATVDLVSTAWLEEHLDAGLFIVDCQPNIHDYIQEHIPGAVYLNEGLFRDSLRGMPGTFAASESVEPVLRRIGMPQDRPVVVYSGTGVFKKWGDGLEQTMVAYALSRYGQGNVLVLNGGLDKWKEEGRPLTKEYPVTGPSEFRAAVRDDCFIGYDEFRKLKDRDDVVVLDARPPAFYAGQGPWMKPGHIPGAVNLPWASLMAERNPRLLRPLDDIEPMLETRGITKDRMVICSCGTGREATNEFLLFKWYLDYPRVRLYEGSFTEWVAHADNDTVTGDRPRAGEPAGASY